ncbi:MAG: 50S ribosomal protein L7/L12 [Candidatus Babeliales bacterium]
MASKSFEKLIEEIGGMTVLELADFVKALESKFGVSAAAPVAMGAPVATASAAAAPAAEEKTEYKATLQSVGEPIKAIKALRASIPTMNLGDAKKATENLPADLGTLPKADAQKLKEALEAAGAKVTLS